MYENFSKMGKIHKKSGINYFYPTPFLIFGFSNGKSKRYRQFLK